MKTPVLAMIFLAIGVLSFVKGSAEVLSDLKHKDYSTLTVGILASRFANTPDYCNVFFGIGGAGADGVSAEYSSALGGVIAAGKEESKHAFQKIHEACAGIQVTGRSAIQ